MDFGKSNIGSTIADWFAGRTHVNKLDKPWFIPAISAATLGGLYGGYTGLDSIMDKIHKRDREKELEDAKEEYRNALVEQYTPDSPAIKRSSSNELQRDLDELYKLHKQATLGKTVNNTAGFGTGMYLTLAALLGGTTGLATYNWAKKNSPDQRLAEAIKQRERLRWATRPPEIYAITKPKSVRINKTTPTYAPGSEEDEQLVSKYSSARKFAALYKP